MSRYRGLPLVALLLLSTLWWGSTVAAHQHWDGDAELCEISLLPHAATVAATADCGPAPAPASRALTEKTGSYFPVFLPCYRSRAPPA